jgi:thiol-disulfide isomerase/thioredoxin
MRNKGIVLCVILALTACAPAPAADIMTKKPTEAMTEMAITESAMTEPAMTGSAMTEPAMTEMPTESMVTEGAIIDGPTWFSAMMTDVNTGDTFTINDFRGKVVLVETMAQWCPKCKQQQDEIKQVHDEMAASTPDLVFITLNTDPNENADDLKEYTARHQYSWLYAVPSKDVVREIGNLFGAQFLNAPSTPVLIIDRKGEAHPLPFGIKSSTDLMKALEPFLNAAM